MLKLMFFTIVSVTNADSYSYLRNLGGSSTGSSGGGSATSGWETEKTPHYDANIKNTVSSCYRTAFSFYTSF